MVKNFINKNNACCISCQNNTFEILFNKNNYDFLKCKNCGLVTLCPLPSEKELEDYYKSKTIGGNYELRRSIERDRSLKKILNLNIQKI